MKLFKNKGFVQYAKLGSGIILLILSFVLLILDKTRIAGKISYPDDTILAFVFLLIGSLCGIASFFFDFGLDILAPIVSSLGFGKLVVMACYPVTDLVTGVGFFSNSLAFAKKLSVIYIILVAIFLLAIVLSIVVCFKKAKKKEEAVPAKN